MHIYINVLSIDHIYVCVDTLIYMLCPCSSFRSLAIAFMLCQCALAYTCVSHLQNALLV